MPQFIFLEADGFAARAKSIRDGKRTVGEEEVKGDYSTVRRPYRGIQIKEDTYATLSVIRPNGSYVPLTSSSARVTDTSSSIGKVKEYADFILQSIDDKRAEKQQIIETFGEPFIYFYGEQPRVVSFSGLLINTEDFNWRSQFWRNYENHLRGTKLVQQNARVYLTYDTILLEGYPINAAAQDVADQPYSIPFQVQMFITAYYDFSDIGATRFPATGELDGLDVANQKLRDHRNQFVSTTLAVRQANLDAQGPKGIAAELRKGIRGLNNLATIAGNYLAQASQVVGGRTVRVPAGVASFLDSLSDATVATGSISTGSQSRFDFKTGKLESVQGSVKIRAPATAKFAPAWVSGVDGSHRGFFWENIDEYPERLKPNLLSGVLNRNTIDTYLNYLETVSFPSQTRSAEYQAALEARVFELLGENGGIVQDLTDGVTFAKSSFGMAMSAANATGTAVTLGRQVAGIRAREVKRFEALTKRGVVSNTSRTGPYISEAALSSFSRQTALSAASGAESGLGASYDQSAYTDPVSSDANYENNYGSRNYDSLIAQNAGVKDTLTEASGDSDVAPEGSEVGLETLNEVYGTGSSVEVDPDTSKRAATAQNAQQGQGAATDEDTRGIRGAEDIDAEIDPVI